MVGYATELAEPLLTLLVPQEVQDSEHFESTPSRFAKMLLEMTTPEEFDFTTFSSTGDNMVTLGPISFYSLCAHHVVPFFGQAYVGYVPDGKLVGLSKIPRAVQQLSKGLWVQEELTVAIADFLENKLDPKGVAVVMKGEHLCMAMRGVKAPGVQTTTSAMLGVFADHERLARMEFLNLIDHGRA
jgi:GTP cyclohydrolase I